VDWDGIWTGGQFGVGSELCRIKRGWHKYTNSWLNQWGIWEDVILQNTDSMKNIITSKFKENIWCDKELEDKRKLRYYKGIGKP